jgi:hypothetical protein
LTVIFACNPNQLNQQIHWLIVSMNWFDIIILANKTIKV